MIAFQGPIDYKLYEAHGGGAGKAVSAVLNNARATRLAIAAVASIAVSKRCCDRSCFVPSLLFQWNDSS